MARAKRTDRTEARRRHRAQFAEDNGGMDEGDELVHEAEAPTGSSTRRRQVAPSRSASSSSASGSGAAAARPPRPGFMSSARAAYHAPNYREDLVLLPRLLVHWSVLLSAALAVAGTAIIVGVGPSISSTTTGAAAATGTTTLAYVGSLLVSLFIGPPPFGAALLIGFMLPRATYLVGLVFGAFAALCLSIIILAQPTESMAGLTVQYLLYAWVFGIVGSAFFAAGIAWYKRFLELLNPNRGQRSRPAAKPVQGRGNVRRNRLSS